METLKNNHFLSNSIGNYILIQIFTQARFYLQQESLYSGEVGPLNLLLDLL